jgi:phosphoglycerate dehydrogenase-like enzyme
MRIVMYFTVLVYREALLAELKDVPEEIVIAETPEELAGAIEGADVFLFNGSAYTPEVAEIMRTKGRSVRWYHSSSAGNEPLISTGVPRHVTVTRSGGHSAPIVAEHAIALLLALARGLPYAMENQRNRNWIRVRGGPRPGTMRSLYGRTALVLGFNHIGQEIGRRLRVLGMKVISVTRSGNPHELADEAYPATRLEEALARASVLVVAAPANAETRGMIGAAELATLQPDGFVVNIGRGPVIQTEAIEAALRDGTILGAGLDVIDPEPLPAEHSLWDAPNLIITPHRAGGGDPTSAQRQAKAVMANLERFRAGEPLQHVLETKVVD